MGKTGAANARVLSEMYRERNVDDGPRSTGPSRVPPSERDAGVRGSGESSPARKDPENG